MKKGLYAILAALAVFALVMTGCDTGGGDDPVKKPDPDKPVVTVKVTFDLNTAAILNIVEDFAVDELDVPEPQTIDYDDVLNSVPALAIVPKTDGIVFLGWNDKQNGTGTAITKDTKFTKNTTLFAQWELYEPVNVTFTLNKDSDAYTAENTQDDVTVEIHKKLTIGDNMPGNAFKDQYTFMGWFTAATGGKQVTAKTDVSDLTITTTGTATVYAQFVADTVVPTASKTVPVAGEWILLRNAWHVVYEFTLPSGKKWSDYSGISAEYQVASDWAVASSSRAVRLYGNFKLTDFDLFQMADTVKSPRLERFAGGTWNNSVGNGQSIMNDQGASNTTIEGLLEKLGYTKAEGTTTWKKDGAADIEQGTGWIPITYPTNGTVATGANSAYDKNRIPHPQATGPFYFGIGIPGQADINKEQIKNVKLLGKDNTVDDVVAKAAYIKDSEGNEYPVFVGYDGGKTPVNGKTYFLSGGTDAASEIYRGDTEPADKPPFVPENPAITDYDFNVGSEGAWLFSNNEATKYFDATTENAAGIFIPITFTAPYDISSYTKVTIEAKFFLDGTEVDMSNNWSAGGQVIYLKGTVDDTYKTDPSKKLAQINNLGKSATYNGTLGATIPVEDVREKAADFTGFAIERGQSGSLTLYNAITITKITFQK